MVVIRLQRTGRKGLAMYRMVVQDARLTPTSGKVTAQLGHYDPHTKEFVCDKEKVAFYLEHGAQPSPRVIRLLKAAGVKLPDWVSLPPEKKSAIRSPEKLRRNRPAEPEPAEESAPEEPAETAPEPPANAEAETTTESEPTAEAAPTDSPAAEEPAAAETAPAPEEATPAPAAAEPEAEPTAEPTEAKDSTDPPPQQPKK